MLDGKQVYFYLSRDRDTNDPKDYLIMLASEIPCAWAINNVSKDIKKKHTSKGYFGIYLLDDPSSENQEVPRAEFNINTDYDTDFISNVLP